MYKIHFFPKRLKAKYPIIGHGNQGTVYKLDENTVLKIYNGFGRRHDRNDDLEVAKRLEQYEFNYYVGPFDIRTYNGLLQSYKMERLAREHKDVVDLKIREYIDSLRGIRRETDIISEAGIQLSDLQEHNICVANGRIRIYDFSDFFLENNKNLATFNNNTINDCFGDLCLMKLSKDNPIFIYDAIFVPFLKSGEKYFEDYLDKKVKNKNMTIRQYVKSLQK